MSAFYNEIDPYAAAWLRNLIAAGHIAPGRVDERSVVEIEPNELAEFTQCHFFAGVGAWSYSLRQAGWSDSRPVWTGSLPCQPFSTAGKGDEFADDRHLWPEWFRLISKCRPVVIFGEQVASPIALAWFDHVSFDLESAQYTVGAVDTCAAGYGAPHIRQRLYFLANDASGARVVHIPTRQQESENFNPGRPSATSGFWGGCDWIKCTDGKRRPIEPGTLPVDDGADVRVGRLRAYGNTICVPQAAEFVRAFMDYEPI